MAKRRPSRAPSAGATPQSTRLAKLRRAIKALDLEALLITAPNDIRYLTGFSGEDSYALVTNRALHVVSDFRFQEELESLARRCKLMMRDGPIDAAAGALISDLELTRVGVQAERLTVNSRRAIAKRAGSRTLVNTSGLLSELRLNKDDSEVRTIRKAVRIQEAALKATMDQIGPGWTELEITALLEYEVKSRGADGPSFHTIVASQANGSKPHYRPSRTRTRSGRPLLIDWGAIADGYCSDMTRTFSFGSWSKTMREIYTIVLEAQEAAIAAVRPGLRCCELDRVARRIITDAGYGDAFGHGLGHGIGLDIHEEPRLSRLVERELEPGMVVTVEPGIYLPGVGGVRIEDDILVTHRGGKNLCSLPKDLEWATR